MKSCKLRRGIWQKKIKALDLDEIKIVEFDRILHLENWEWFLVVISIFTPNSKIWTNTLARLIKKPLVQRTSLSISIFSFNSSTR